MCGIFGFSKLTPKNRELAKFLAYAMESRGDDSWGASDGEEVIKFVGPISRNFHLPAHWTRAIVHARGASVGNICERNAHPFTVERKGKAPIIGIHNGGVHNYKDLSEKYPYRHCEVDSEHIFWQIAEGKPMHELRGRGTIAWFDEYNDERLIHLVRWNLGDLEVAKTAEDGVIFCSTREPLERGGRLAKIEKLEVYQIFSDGYKYILDEDQAFNTEKKMGFDSPITYFGSVSTEKTRNRAWDKDFTLCIRCCRTHTEKIVCHSCLREIIEQFRVERRAANFNIA